MSKVGVVFLLYLMGALVFEALHLPILWLLGPIFILLCAQFVVGQHLMWPAILRNTGLVIVSVAIGQQFNVDRKGQP